MQYADKAGAIITAAPRPNASVLRLTGIVKTYPGVTALSDVSIDIRPAEIHALVGENGAGKSTLVGVAAGSVTPDSGHVEIDGETSDSASPQWSRNQWLAIVYQEPALLPDLTVAENMRLAMPSKIRPGITEQVDWARGVLQSWERVARIDPRKPVRSLAPDARFVVEIARAMAEEPKVLILDEPTEHLLPEAAEELFIKIQELVAAGTAIVYISHKIKDVKRIAERISVLRDGRSEGTYEAAGLTEQGIIDLVVGLENERNREQVTKPDVELDAPIQLALQNFTGAQFSNVSLEVRRGEIVGFAGIEGQGQRDVMRALAGLVRSRGSVHVGSREVSVRSAPQALRSGIAYVPQDRHREGVFSGLSLRANAAVSALPRMSTAGVVDAGKRTSSVNQIFETLRVKAPSADVNIETLSGGNQQKVVLSRILLTESEVILADEPTQGVDVGARAEIYEILRKAAARGAAVIVLSSSAVELEEICNRVYVFSQGKVAAELVGDEVSERAITSAALTTTQFRDTEAIKVAKQNAEFPFRERFFGSDLFPAVILAVAIGILAIIAGGQNEYYFTVRNFGLMLPLIATLAFFAIAQQFAMMVGGIDLSVGPLASFLVVVGSFVLTVDHTSFGLFIGVLIVVAVAVGVGVINWTLIVLIRITPLIATLITFTALQGLAFLLRPLPGGTISPSLSSAVTMKLGFVPVSIIVVVAIAIMLDFWLRRSTWGVKFRGVGSNDTVAARVGVPSKWVMLGAYVACSLSVVPAGLLLMAQAGTGNSTIGDPYVLSSIGAVVLGGATLFGGRGSFVGVLLGAALVIQANTVAQFLGLSAHWQLWFIGGLTLVAGSVYSKIRSSEKWS